MKAAAVTALRQLETDGDGMMNKLKTIIKKYKTPLLMIMAAVLIISVVIIPTYTLLVKQEEVSNSFTTHDFGIELLEPEYDALSPEERKSLIPNRMIAKDPQVKNTQETDAFVFLKVTVPLAEVTDVDSSSASFSIPTIRQDFDFTSNVQTYTVTHTGFYKLEAWGAQGGSALHGEDGKDGSPTGVIEGGHGGYSSGVAYLTEGQTIYVCVGGQGESIAAKDALSDSSATDEFVNGGYNGGGKALIKDFSEYYYLGSGGGATHFALSDGVLSGLSGNKNDVLLVAGGGGGSYYRYYENALNDYYYYYGSGGVGGGENGGSGQIHTSNLSGDFDDAIFSGGGQTDNTGYNDDNTRYGSFGQGVDGDSDAVNNINFYDSGAGGGWYGGGKCSKGTVGGGGSGYFGKSLTNGTLLAGDQSFAGVSGSEETGHKGNGHARITYLSKRNQEIFYLKTEGTAQSVTDNSFHDTGNNPSDKEYWIELPDCEEGTDLSGKTRTYVFGYSTYIKKDAQTKPLFDKIQLKNILQYEVLPSDNITINVNAYGIQADYLEGIKKDDGADKRLMNAAQLTTIYSYIDTSES